MRKPLKIKPLIKWTGGKYEEFDKFKQFIPDFERYIEPFFGGGGVFFALQPKHAVLNDKSKDLINFYNNISNPKLKKELLTYADAWDKIKDLNNNLLLAGNKVFSDFLDLKIGETELISELTIVFSAIDPAHYHPLFDDDFCVDAIQFRDFLLSSVADKFRRILRISQKENKIFNEDQLKDHFETGLKSGLYLYHRSLMNQNFQNNNKIPTCKAIATWYFVREFCYASMFRYNAKGGFNIPYGGIAYNKKNFRNKVDLLFSSTLKELMKGATFYNTDFAHFLDLIQPTENDFIFLDPPYDSEFSEYDQNSFTQEDQKRLANKIIGLSSKWMMVIKETPFIRSLYQSKEITIQEFEKNYTYNVRGRNNRKTQHLIITNYPFADK